MYPPSRISEVHDLSIPFRISSLPRLDAEHQGLASDSTRSPKTIKKCRSRPLDTIYVSLSKAILFLKSALHPWLPALTGVQLKLSPPPAHLRRMSGASIPDSVCLSLPATIKKVTISHLTPYRNHLKPICCLLIAGNW